MRRFVSRPRIVEPLDEQDQNEKSAEGVGFRAQLRCYQRLVVAFAKSVIEPK